MPRLAWFLLVGSVLSMAGCQTWPPGNLDDLPPTAALPESSVRGEVQIYYFDNISGTTIASLTGSAAFPNEPDEAATVGELRGVTGRGDNYGSLVRGYIHPPISGVYTFYVSGDDETELWLSSSSDPDLTGRIATVPGYTSAQDYNKYSAQRSPAIELDSGDRYYFEIRHKEGGGADHFSIAWEGPGFSRQLISGQDISSFAGEPSSGDEQQSVEEAYRLGYTVGFFDGEEGLAFAPTYPPLDNDQDGIYDNWETANRLNPSDPTDANSDPDDDLLVAADEFLLGTRENNPDSDGDGIPDGAEFALSLDPLDASDAGIDTDGDGYSNLEEYLAGTEPADSTSMPQVPDAVTEIVHTGGVVGQYFQGTSFNEFLLARNDSDIQFQAGSGAFVPQQPNDNFSARWYGVFSAPHTDGNRSYTLRIRTDDGARLYLDGEQSISAWRDQGATTYTATVSLQPEQSVSMMMEYYERGGAAVAELSIVDGSTGTELTLSDVVSSPDLSQSSDTDTDADGIPDTWELRNGLSPWRDDASEINNGSGITNIDAFNSSLSPWTLEPLASPESPSVDDDSTSTPAPSEPDTGSATLSWTAPLTRVDGSAISLSEIQSYEILYGSSPDSLSNTVTVDGSQTSAKITGLNPGPWYFSIRVIDTNGLTSDNSQIITYTVQ